MRIVDVSNNNGPVKWAAVRRAGVKGVWLKVTEGRTYADSTYLGNDLAARAAGLRVGGYHFARPANHAEQDASNFLAHLRLRPGDLLPVLDLELTEGYSAVSLARWAETWLRYVERQIGAKPVLYSSDSFLRSYLPDVYPKYPVWVASYGAKPKVKGWAAWQWTDRDSPFGLDESYAANAAALIYRPPLRKKLVKAAKKPLVPCLTAYRAYKLLNPKKVA